MTGKDLSVKLDAPLRFAPLPKVRVWGGDALKCRAPSPPADPVGESWELADHGADTTIVDAGPLAGTSLHALLEADPAALCGQAIDPASPGVFPLLLKLIDAQQDLSVQVHPDDAYAGRQQAGELGKTEAWYVLQAAPHGRVYRGVKPGVDRARFAAALQDGTVADLLHGFPVAAGDVIHMPAGTIHALGAGVQIAEIQQNSDTTYRVFDWNRVGLDGHPRELHIDHALAVSRFADSGPATCTAEDIEQPGCRRERFVACEKFCLERLGSFRGRPIPVATAGERFHILTVVAGSVEIEAAGGSLRRGRWETALVPAAVGAYALHASPDAELLLFYRP